MSAEAELAASARRLTTPGLRQPAFITLAVLIIALGVYPKPVLDVINPAVQSTLSQVHSTDPVPAHPAPAQAVAASAVKKGSQP